MRYNARGFCSIPGCLFHSAVQCKLRTVSSSRSGKPLFIPRHVHSYDNVQIKTILLSSGAFVSEQKERHHGPANVTERARHRLSNTLKYQPLAAAHGQSMARTMGVRAGTETQQHSIKWFFERRCA